MSIRDELGNLCNWRVRLHLKSLGSPRVPEFTALKNAQRIYGQYGICMEFASGESIPNAVETSNQTLSLTAVDVGSCSMPQAMTPQQEALFKHGSRQFALGTDITCYWVENVKSDGRILLDARLILAVHSMPEVLAWWPQAALHGHLRMKSGMFWVCGTRAIIWK